MARLRDFFRRFVDACWLATMHPNWTLDADARLDALGLDATERAAVRDTVTAVFGRVRLYSTPAATAVMLVAAGVDVADLPRTLRAVKMLSLIAGVSLNDAGFAVATTVAQGRVTSDTAHRIRTWGLLIHAPLAVWRGEHPYETAAAIAMGRVPATDLIAALADL